MKKIKKLLSILGFGTIGGLLGAFGGADQTSKAWRRICIPSLITLYALYMLHNWWLITIMSMCGVLSIGYGIPDSTDEGSSLGKFWYNLFNGNHLLTDIFARGTLGLLVSLSLISIPILKGNWLMYGLCSLGIITVYSTISWRGLGGFTFKGKYLLWSEFLTYSFVVLFAQIIIGL